jgi:glucosamine--fructose-6-phosphate aminotransferase (isomerizing)
MCGIIAVLNKGSRYSDLAGVILDSLRKLEYRGYDSVGIAVIGTDSSTTRLRSTNRVDGLAKAISNLEPVKAISGIGHTRWATHGGVTIDNAHPHITGSISIVHNGIVENYTKIKKDLVARGCRFESETDTEVISQLISSFMEDGLSFVDSFKRMLKTIEGASAIVAMCDREPGTLIGAMYGSPLVIGCNNEQIYLASDVLALSSISDNAVYLERKEMVIVTEDSYELYNKDMNKFLREKTCIGKSSYRINDKLSHESYMLTEIHEEPSVLLHTYDKYSAPFSIADYKEVCFIACGTSYYAGLLAKYWIEALTGTVKASIEIASEFRYRDPVLSKECLYIFISQSGETMDTLYAMRQVKDLGYDVFSIVNVENSSMHRESTNKILTYAGPEIAVASTKALICQILTTLLLTIGKQKINADEIAKAMQNVLNKENQFMEIAKKLSTSRAIFYIGRGTSYPIALEGALKMKELAYISSEGYPAGEIKHGPIAIIDENVYTVVLAPKDKYFEKTMSNAHEILARNGPILVLGANSDIWTDNKNVDIIEIDSLQDSITNPFALTTAVHLLAYYAARTKGLDIDKPRNLAKSVTVE